MLSDDIVAIDQTTLKRKFKTAGASPDIGDLAAGYMATTFEWWKQALRGSQRFALDADVTSAVHHVAQGRPSSILAAKDYIRLPFEQCWFEWPESARSAVDHSELILSQNTRLATPKRMGFLCKQNSDGTIMVQMAWQSYSKSEVIQTSPLVMIWDQRRHIPLDNTNEELHAMRPDMPKKEYDAVRVTGAWVTMGLSAFQALAYPEDRRALFEQSVHQNMKMFKSDWDGEGRFFAALLIMLNTKNGVKIESDDLTALNRSRRKTGKRPLLEHRLVQIRPGAADRNKRGYSEKAGIVPRLHLVRGHFKVRASGVFWWSPFVRGDASVGKVTHDYHIRS